MKKPATNFSGDLPNEVWKPVFGFEGLYEASNLGRIKSLPKIRGYALQKRELLIKQKVNRYGYLTISVCKDGKRKCTFVHRFVALAFIPNPENKKHVNHKNGIKTDNNLHNLEWATCKENVKHAFDNKLRVGKAYNRKLTNEQILEIRSFGRTIPIAHLAIKYNISSACMSRIVNNLAYLL